MEQVRAESADRGIVFALARFGLDRESAGPPQTCPDFRDGSMILGDHRPAVWDVSYWGDLHRPVFEFLTDVKPFGGS
jgi:hypothetical protein